MAAQYIPESLDTLAEAVLAQAILDIQNGIAQTRQHWQTQHEAQRNAEDALAWLQGRPAQSWLDELEYPTTRLDDFITTAGRGILAARIAQDFSDTATIARRRQAKRERSRKEKTA